MVLGVLATLVVGYLLGNLNGSVITSKLVEKEDVRTHGSGNAGLTNFIRNYGIGSALLVILVDCGKAALGCFFGGWVLGLSGYGLEGLALGGLSVMLGHDFPAFLGFKGGKGILSGFVIALIVDWRIGVLIFVVFAACYLATQYVSLGSVMAAAAFGIGFVIFHHDNLPVMLCGVLMGVLAIYMHRGNIARLLSGTESKVSLFKKK